MYGGLVMPRRSIHDPSVGSCFWERKEKGQSERRVLTCVRRFMHSEQAVLYSVPRIAVVSRSVTALLTGQVNAVLSDLGKRDKAVPVSLNRGTET